MPHAPMPTERLVAPGGPVTRAVEAGRAPVYPWPASMPAPTREEIHDLIDGLIAFLDAMDGEADLEPEEPETGAREWCGSGAQRFDVGAVA